MALTVQTNNAAVTALKHLNINSANMNKSLERLSSGFRVNSAADDASGFAIAAKLTAQSDRLKAASQNAMQATAMVKMADAGVNEIQNMISRIQTLAVQASSANNAGELDKLEAERVKLESQIDKIANSTNYNGTNLLNGINAQSAAVTGVTGVAASAGAVTQGGTAGTADQLAITGTATFSTAATFTVKTDGAGNITNVTVSADLLAAADGTTLAAASSTNLITASNTAVTIAGLTITATAATGVGASSTATFATSGGTDFVAAAAAGASAYTGALSFQAGADNNTSNRVSIDLRNSYTTTDLGLSGSASAVFTTQAAAQAYIDTSKTALNALINQRADLGATQNQLAFVQANLATSIEQSVASVSSIKDTDMAAEMANFTKNQILTQAGTSMLAQANQAAQNVLQLFR
jgi:flagellin